MRKHRSAHPALDSIAFAVELLIASAIAAVTATVVAYGLVLVVAHAAGVI